MLLPGATTTGHDPQCQQTLPAPPQFCFLTCLMRSVRYYYYYFTIQSPSASTWLLPSLFAAAAAATTKLCYLIRHAVTKYCQVVLDVEVTSSLLWLSGISHMTAVKCCCSVWFVLPQDASYCQVLICALLLMHSTLMTDECHLWAPVNDRSDCSDWMPENFVLQTVLLILLSSTYTNTKYLLINNA